MTTLLNSQKSAMMQGLEKKEVLVVGGGIAGITAASQLSSLGIKVLLIEKDHFIGGRGARLTCKATSHCMKCNYCLVEDALRQLSETGNIAIKTLTSIHRLKKSKKGFEVTLIENPRVIDPERCTDCGKCLELCPYKGKGAILTAPSANIQPFYSIDPQVCGCRDPRPCEEACPHRAIDFERHQEELSYKCHGIVLATGFTPYDPSGESRYGRGRIKNIITALELEEMLRGDEHFSPLNGTKKAKVAFVQCVGSRNPKIQRDYCSRVCCGYAIRMALRLLESQPDLDITFFYMDVQNFGKDFQKYFFGAKEKLKFIRGLPGDYYQVGKEKVRVSFYHREKAKTVVEDFHLVVLSVGIGPNEEAIATLGEPLGVEVDDMGFFVVPQGIEGIVAAGTSTGPMDVAETISSAKASALNLANYLSHLD